MTDDNPTGAGQDPTPTAGAQGQDSGAPQGQTAQGQDSGARQQAEDMTGLPAWAQTLIRELRQQSATYRVAARQAEEQRRTEENERLTKNQEFKQLSENLTTQVADLKPKAERTEALEAFVQKMVDSRVKALPEAHRGLVPKYADPLQTLEWLEASAPLLAAPAAPNFNPGAKGDQPAQIPDEARAIAQRMGVSAETLAKHMPKK